MIYLSNRNNRGFASLLLLSTLPLFFLLLFSVAFLYAYIDIKTNLRSLCLTEGIQTQKQIIEAEKKLFQLNLLSNSLKTKLILTYVQLAAAVAAENPPAIALAIKEIELIKSQQKNLDTLQKTIIYTADLLAKNQSFNLYQNLLRKINLSQNNWSYYLLISGLLQIVTSPKVAVHPTSDDLAPNYELDTDHSETQRLALIWQLSLFSNRKAQQLLNTKNYFYSECSVYSNFKENTWHIEIQTDKF